MPSGTITRISEPMLNQIKQAAKDTFSWCGLEIKRKRNKSDLAVDWGHYRSRGLNLIRCCDSLGINVLLDIGANQGQYSASFRKLGFRGRIVSFEPLQSAFDQLAQRSQGDDCWESLRLAVGDENRDMTMMVAANIESSSLLPMLGRHTEAYPESKYIGEEHVRMVTLDSVCATRLDATDRVMAKLDVQGYELKALQGALESLPKIRLIDIELSLVPLYEGQPNFVEVIHFLQTHGFTPISFGNAFTDPRTGDALQIDVVLTRRNGGAG